MKRLFLALVFCLALVAVPVQAQQPPTLSSLEISIWPEYDRPDVLVIYRAQFAESTPLPVQVDLLLPPGVQQPSAVAFVGDGDQRLNQEYTTSMEGDQLKVSFSLSTQAFQLEYYAPFAYDANGLREFAYSYTADYPIDALSLEVQVPPSADAFAVDPPAGSTIQASDGLTYEIIDAGSLTQGASKSWTITYQKSNSDLTADTLDQTQPAEPAPSTPAQTSDNSTIIIFTLSFIALVAVGVGAFWLGKRTQPVPATQGASRGKNRSHGGGRGGGRNGGRGTSRQQLSTSRSGQDGEDALFCYQCGTSLRSDSEFCHKCGAKVRDG